MSLADVGFAFLRHGSCRSGHDAIADAGIPIILDSMTDIGLRPTTGLISGANVQIAEGRYPDTIGAGLTMTDEVFDLVEPHIKTACPTWTSLHRYGLFELSMIDQQRLAKYLLDASTEAQSATTRELFERLSIWIDARCEAEIPITILGY